MSLFSLGPVVDNKPVGHIPSLGLFTLHIPKTTNLTYELDKRPFVSYPSKCTRRPSSLQCSFPLTGSSLYYSPCSRYHICGRWTSRTPQGPWTWSNAPQGQQGRRTSTTSAHSIHYKGHGPQSSSRQHPSPSSSPSRYGRSACCNSNSACFKDTIDVMASSLFPTS